MILFLNLTKIFNVIIKLKMESLKEKALKKQPIIDDLWWKIDGNLKKYDVYEREGKKVIEVILNLVLAKEIKGLEEKYKEIDTILYGMKVTNDVVTKAVGFMFDVVKVLSKDLNKTQESDIKLTFNTCPDLQTIFKQVSKYHKISCSLQKSYSIREYNIKTLLPTYIMSFKAHSIHYLLDQWMYL